MHLGRAQVSTVVAPPVSSISFSHDSSLFAIAGDTGYEVWSTWPLRLLRRRALPGTLQLALPLAQSPLVALQGGGPSPLYPPNKVVLFHDGLGQAVAELEFGERIRGITARPRGLLVALLRRTIWFEYGVGSAKGPGFWITKRAEWATAINERGLMAVSTAPGSAVLALPGRQPGHVQLIHLPSSSPSETPSFRSPILLCHTHPLSVLACSPDGAYISTASERGTLIRVWDVSKGRLERELRRGMDRVEMWGLAFEGGPGKDDGAKSHSIKGGRILGWSDKGTVHIWSRSSKEGQHKTTAPSQPQSLQSILSRKLPLPKYFSSETSKLQYHLPRKNPHAFSSVASAATAVPGLRPKQEYGQRNEIDLGDTERFVVCWINVDVKVDENERPKPSLATQEERLSFDSETSVRTATPRLRFELATSRKAPKRVSVTSLQERTAPTFKQEKQIIAITHAGDWYRLRLPDIKPLDAADDSEERQGTKTECELVEYRRLGVGGGGW